MLGNNGKNYLKILIGCIILAFFFYQDFLHRHWRFTGQERKGGDHLIFHSTTSTRSEHWHIYLQLCMWDDYHVFSITTLLFTATRWDLPRYWIAIWVIDWWCNICLFVWIDTRFLLQRFGIGNRWIWTCIDDQPCITSEPTNQVC